MSKEDFPKTLVLSRFLGVLGEEPISGSPSLGRGEHTTTPRGFRAQGAAPAPWQRLGPTNRSLRGAEAVSGGGAVIRRRGVVQQPVSGERGVREPRVRRARRAAGPRRAMGKWLEAGRYGAGYAGSARLRRRVSLVFAAVGAASRGRSGAGAHSGARAGDPASQGDPAGPGRQRLRPRGRGVRVLARALRKMKDKKFWRPGASQAFISKLFSPSPDRDVPSPARSSSHFLLWFQSRAGLS